MHIPTKYTYIYSDNICMIRAEENCIFNRYIHLFVPNLMRFLCINILRD